MKSRIAARNKRAGGGGGGVRVLDADDADRPVSEDNDEGGEYTVGVPLAKLIKRKLTNAPELVILANTRSVPAEKFRRLKTVLANDTEDSPQVIVVTSGAPGEGKTLVSTNLALAFAADKRGEVLLIDADLRRPSVGRWLNPPPKLGMTEILKGKIEVDHAILELENTPLKVLPAGTPARDPVELLSSDYTRRLIGQLRRRFQRIIIDTPPVIPFTDAEVLGSLSDGAILVARSGKTLKAMFEQAVASITSTRLLGTVLNDTTFNLADRDSYHLDKQYYRYYQQERKP